MRKIVLIIGAFIIVLMNASPTTAIFSSPYTLQGTLSANTTTFFLGKTSITGNSTGSPMEQMVQSPLVEEMNAFPLIGTCTFAKLNTVFVAKNIDISKTSSLEDLYTLYSTHITEYTDVTITAENGVFLLGVNHGAMHVSTKLPYAVSTFLPFEIFPNVATRFFLTASVTPVTAHCSGDFTVLTGVSNTSIFQIQDTNGAIQWSGTANNTYLVFQQNTFTVTQHPPLFVFPVPIDTSNKSFAVSLVPAASQDIVTAQLITNISDIISHLRGFDTTEITETFTELDEFIATTSLVANGAMVLFQTNDTVLIDHTPQHFSDGGFVRFITLDITNVGSSDALSITGDSSLVFLGNHFYNPQAKSSTAGTAFPFELLVLWIAALCVFLSVHLLLRPTIDEQKTYRMKRYAFVLQFILLVIGILLLDSEVNSQFGISAFTALFTHGFSSITGIFLLVELIIWVVGFLIFGLPVQLLVNSGLQAYGIGKEGRGIGRGIGFLSIWIFCGFYLLLLMNVILSLISVNIFSSVG